METQLLSPSAQTTRQLDTRRWLMLIVVLGATLIGAIDIFIVNVAVPSIERDLHTGFAQVQLVAAGYTLAYAVLLVTGGRLGDLFGRKRLFLLGVAGFTFCSALCGFAPNALLLIVFRIAQGAAAAMMTPQVLSFIQVSFAPSERPVAMSAYVVTLGLASILGLVLGGGLIAINLFGLGWRSIFLVNLPIGGLVLIAAAWLVPESKDPGTRELDYGGVALLTLSLSLLIFPLVVGGNSGWPLWSIICLVLALPALVVFWLYEQWMVKQGKVPLVAPTLLRQRQFRAGNLTNLLNGTLWNGTLFLFSIYLQTILHFTPLQSGLAMTVGSVAFIIASGTSPALVRRLGRRSLSLGAGVVAVGNLLVLVSAYLLVDRWGAFPLLGAFFILAFGQALFYTPLMPRTLEHVSPEHIGTASGVYTTTVEASGALGVAIIGSIYAILTLASVPPAEAFALTTLLITLFSGGTILLVRSLEH